MYGLIGLGIVLTMLIQIGCVLQNTNIATTLSKPDRHYKTSKIDYQIGGRFDTQGNGLLLYQNTDSTSEKQSYGVTKVDNTGLQVWNNNGLIDGYGNPTMSDAVEFIVDDKGNVYLAAPQMQDNGDVTISSAKLHSDGTLAWQNDVPVVGLSSLHPQLIGGGDLLTSGASNDGAYYVAHLSNNQVNVLAYDTHGVPRTIYTEQYDLDARMDLRLKIANDGSLYLYSNHKFTQLSPAGHVMHQFIYSGGRVDDYLIDSTGAIYIVSYKNVRKLQADGSPLWEQYTEFERPISLYSNYLIKAHLSPTSTLSLLYSGSYERVSVSTYMDGYELIQFNAQGVQISTVVRDIPYAVASPFVFSSVGYLDRVDLQFDQQNNFYLIEQHITAPLIQESRIEGDTSDQGIISLFPRISSLIRKYDPQGNYLSEVHTRDDCFSIGEPRSCYDEAFFFKEDGSLSIFFQNSGLYYYNDVF